MQLQGELVLKLGLLYDIMKTRCEGMIIFLLDEVHEPNLDIIQETMKRTKTMIAENSQVAEELEAMEKAVASVIPSLSHRTFADDLSIGTFKVSSSQQFIANQLEEEDCHLKLAVQCLSSNPGLLGKVCTGLHEVSDPCQGRAPGQLADRK